ncbi:hypothetical protein GCM10027047_01350 [Rhodococcus aerolatus]
MSDTLTPEHDQAVLDDGTRPGCDGSTAAPGLGIPSSTCERPAVWALVGPCGDAELLCATHAAEHRIAFLVATWCRCSTCHAEWTGTTVRWEPLR